MTKQQAVDKINDLMNAQVELPSLATPGWSISAKEVAHEGGIFQYHLYLSGAPKDALLNQFTLPVGDLNVSVTMSGISVGKDGVLTCAGRLPEQCGNSNNPDDPIEFTMRPYPGESFRYIFSGPAGKVGIILVPVPIESKQGGCTLSAVRLTPLFELAYVSGTGYSPDTDIHYHVSSGTDHDEVIHADKTGTIRFSLLASPKKGQSTGTSTVKITDSKCSPTVSFKWGSL